MIKQDDELDTLEENIRKLKNRYDQFFAGIQKFPPMQERRNVEVFIYEIGKQRMRDNARRFRYNTLLTRYNQFREMWARKMREREEGPLDFRRRQAAMSAAPSVPREPPPPQPVTSRAADPYVKVAPGTNGEEIRRLYDQIEQKHHELGKMPSITMEQLDSMVRKQSELVRSKYNVNAVAFRVDVVDGKVKLKAKPLQD
ncbi:MAG TPA: MXAN_5187 C-terminal domain-containing protein [Thermoanaerobaculia bacterium]|nr:MXAN_5187 C-terminal domain-containing protein [Thermoanaerobaculia bacterium]